MAAASFPADRGARVVEDLVRAIQENRQALSDIDGAIGDGDHGVNMSKGFTRAGEELAGSPGGLSDALKTVSSTLMSTIGGAMGPLYGMLFRGLAKGCDGQPEINRAVFGRMLEEALAAVRKVSQAAVGDKTLIDALVPAVEAYRRAAASGTGFAQSLQEMARAAEGGRDSTKDLVARIGRASRLGERSRGTLDPGATSCALLLRTMADSMGRLLAEDPAEGAPGGAAGT
ncbi:MAG: dihydroxyacetone kinase subunit L [Spirochaetales bacterium]|nr:dihydroxyacetone kinase subunit L [Spirochaetales bacterium]